MGSTRRNITWDLTRSDAYELAVYWTEGDPGEWHELILRSTAGPWETWQIAGVVAAVAAGTDPDLIVAPDDAAPDRTGLLGLAQRAGDALLAAADRLTTGRNLTGVTR